MPPPSIRIKDALDKCPIKAEYFKKSTKKAESSKKSKFNDKLLNALDDYLEELRPKKYSFVTDGIEDKKDITRLGMSDNQLKKLNRVSKFPFPDPRKYFPNVMTTLSVSDTIPLSGSSL